MIRLCIIKEISQKEWQGSGFIFFPKYHFQVKKETTQIHQMINSRIDFIIYTNHVTEQNNSEILVIFHVISSLTDKKFKSN